MPPLGAAVQVAEPPVVTFVGDTEHDAVSGGGACATTTLPHERVTDWLPEVTVTLPDLLPAVEYGQVTERVAPVRPLWPLQE